MFDVIKNRLARRRQRLTVILDVNEGYVRPEFVKALFRQLNDAGYCHRRALKAKKPPDYYSILENLFCFPDRLPVAALFALADDLAVENKYWICLDPVHFQSAHRGLILEQNLHPAINASEVEQLYQELSNHFAGEPVIVQSSTENRWYVICDEQADNQFHTLSAVYGKEVTSHLPEGQNSMYWRGFLNECAMLLHQSSVNEAREREANTPINGVWLWGQGALPSTRICRYDVLVSDSALIGGLARFTGARWVKTPKELQEQMTDRTTSMLWHHSFQTSQYAHENHCLQAIVSEFLEPLRRFLDRRNLNAELLIPGLLRTKIYSRKPWYWI